MIIEIGKRRKNNQAHVDAHKSGNYHRDHHWRMPDTARLTRDQGAEVNMLNDM
jgi:hypothetical protein